MNVSTRIASAWKKSTMLLGLSLCAVFTAAAAETAPVLKDNSIEIAGKTLTMKQDGSFDCKNSKGELLFSCEMPYFWAVKSGKPEWPWRNKHMDKEKTKLVRDGNKYSWELWFKDEGLAPVCIIKQSLEVLKDGQLEFRFRYSFPEKTEAYEFKHWTHFVCPGKTLENEKITLANSTVEMNKEMKPVTERSAKWTFAPDKPEKRFVYETKKGSANRFMIVRWRNNRFEALVEQLKPGQETVVYFDLR